MKAIEIIVLNFQEIAALGVGDRKFDPARVKTDLADRVFAFFFAQFDVDLATRCIGELNFGCAIFLFDVPTQLGADPSG